MKNFFKIHRLLLACSILFLLTGCVHYDITLGNGDVVRARNKPKLNELGYYVFQDLSGKEVAITPMRVRQIEPVRRGSRPTQAF